MHCMSCCKEVNYSEKIQKFKNHTMHIRGKCEECHSFISYIPYKKSNLVTEAINYLYTNKEEHRYKGKNYGDPTHDYE